jgi:hypothetical protein
MSSEKAKAISTRCHVERIYETSVVSGGWPRATASGRAASIDGGPLGLKSAQAEHRRKSRGIKCLHFYRVKAFCRSD